MKKKKRRQKNGDGRDLHRWERDVMEEKFPHTRKHLHLWGQGVGMGWGEASEPQRRVQQRVQRAKQRDSHTEDQCRPKLTSLRSLSANLPGWVGAQN